MWRSRGRISFAGDMPTFEATSGSTFADRLARRYQDRLSSETLMVNELYLTLLYRPVTGAAPTLAVHGCLSRGEKGPGCKRQ